MLGLALSCARTGDATANSATARRVAAAVIHHTEFLLRESLTGTPTEFDATRGVIGYLLAS
jgi:hypothetical protein